MDETQVVVVAAVVAAVAAVLASAVGAGGAILAQMLTVRATDKASAKRFEWEQKQAIRREKAERDAIFAETTRELFSKYLAAHYEYRLELARSCFEDSSTVVEKMDAAVEKYAGEILQIQSEIALIAPSLADATQELLSMGVDAGQAMRKAAEKDGATGAKGLRGEFDAFHDSVEDCREAMAAHLRGEPIPEA
ncbi:hypothetical protein [Nocardioides albus]|uniref:Uncharacterized protein n=1 Tax=Nocardioides albus TaxID=1841 RepID=A0A7W5F806_9ACTN|nr:hypothetical protein [Nocardioides albus]MBB3088556.1 hypothetical protein [Nocardioides albus]GGU17120.1 hypothetical protein GCM10007979_14470 [Nocardioides albus]